VLLAKDARGVVTQEHCNFKPGFDFDTFRGFPTDSLADLTSSTRLDTPRSGSSGAARPRESRSPFLSRRRKAGSYQIEREDEQAELSETRLVQDAIANAKTLTKRLIDALSSSNLHREHGSRIHPLYQRATELHGFQLPSSRIVGLVGDSGAGKSKLINSLLDKMGLARLVRHIFILPGSFR